MIHFSNIILIAINRMIERGACESASFLLSLTQLYNSKYILS
nr:MAG TPA: hypothetical protein [Caudoviricetes sp.]